MDIVFPDGKNLEQWRDEVDAALTSTPTPTPPTPPPGFEKFKKLTYPVWGAVTPQASNTFMPDTDLTFGGVSRLVQVEDPGGSRRTTYLHRTLKADAAIGSNGKSTKTVRSEKQYIYQPDSFFPLFQDHWFTFAIRTKGDEYPTTNDGNVPNNIHLVWQTHSQTAGSTQPPMSLQHDIGHNKRFWRRAWNTKPNNTWQVNGGPNPDTEAYADYPIGAFPQPDVWHKYIVHFRPGYLTSHEPCMHVWEAVGNDTYTKIVTSTANTDFNEYNCPEQSYNRIGIYKWAGTFWHNGKDSVAVYGTEIWSAQNTGDEDLFEAARFTLIGL